MPPLDEERVLQFHEMGLDERIVKAIVRSGWKQPTAIQEQAIPFALKGESGRGDSRIFPRGNLPLPKRCIRAIPSEIGSLVRRLNFLVRSSSKMLGAIGARVTLLKLTSVNSTLSGISSRIQGKRSQI